MKQEFPIIRTGLFGGTFDPPTIAHLIAAEWSRTSLSLDSVWFIPAATNPFKQDRKVTPAEIRLEMLRAAVENNSAFQIVDYEIEQGGASYTIDTLRFLQKEHPQRRFVLIMGGDAISGLPNWKDSDEILERVEIAAVVRPGWDIEHASEQMKSSIKTVEIPPLPISATMVRDRVSRGKSIRYLVPESVRAIIEHRQLYA